MNIGKASCRSAFLICLFFIGSAFSQKTIRVGEITSRPGEKRSGFIRVPAGNDGPAVSIPVTVINGRQAGPVLALTAGVHGYEYPPILALQRLSLRLNPEELAGTVILVHIVNVPSFLQRTTYYNPYDGRNQNRAFPGKIDGSMTQRIAHRISEEVIDLCDILIDNHCGDSNEDLTTYLYCTEIGRPDVDARTRELAVNYGFKMIIHQRVNADDPGATWCAHSALFKGKPALTVESGRLGRIDEADILAIVRGTINTMQLLDMIPGEPERMFDPIWVSETTYIRSEHQGLFYPLVKGGQHVEAGEMVGYLTDFFGNVIQKANAPHSGIVMYVISTPPMSVGEPMVKIGKFK